MQFLIVLAAFLVAANAQVIMSGQCRNETLVGNFDVPKYAGLWYETYRYEFENQVGGDCVTATYSPAPVGVSVLNAMVINGTRYTIEGSAIVAPDANGRGKLLVNFPSVGTSYSDYLVLSTDYTNYSLVYGCSNVSPTTKKVASWVLSRKSVLSPQSILAMNEALNSVDSLTWDNYRQTDQSEKACQTTKY